MIAGRMPFAANSVSERIANLINKEPEHLSRLVPGVSKELESIVSKALQKDRNDRYISMRELLADLRNARVEVVRVPSVSESEQRTIKLEPRSTEQARWRYSPMAVLAAILIIGLAVAGAAGLVANWYRNSETPPKAVGGLNRSPAYDLYMRGKVKAGSENREEIEGAIKVLEEAVTIDRNYAEPYAALAVAYNTKAFQFAPASEKKQISENAEIAVEKALRLDPNSAEAHFARGVVLWTHNKRFPHEQAIRAFKRALAIDPNHDEARHRLSMVYSHIGLLDEAQTELKKALELNPNNTLARFRAAVFYYYQGKYEEALATLKTVPGDVSPALASRTTADTLSHLGRNAEAAAIVEEYLRSYPQDEGGNVTSVKAILLAKDQKYKEAQESIDRAIEIGRGFGHFHHTAFNIASAYAIMKRTDDAMKWLQDAADDGFPCYSFFAIDPNLDNLRQDRQFIDFMEKGKARMETFRRQIY
jgi:tetratricopeptide (TPR) repeat protein